MSERNRNITSKSDDFLQYRRKRMTGKEMNDFERHLQKDPFAEEAAEGFKNIDPDQAEMDLQSLQKQISKRTGGHRIQWYGIAASVAVIMIFSTVLVVVNKKKPAEIAYAPSVLNKTENKEPEAEELVVPPAKHTPEKILKSIPEKTAKKVVQQKREVEIPVSDEVISEDNAKEELKPVEGLKMAEQPFPVFVKEKTTVLRNAIVADTSGDTTSEIRFEYDVPALNEIVVVGYGASKKNYVDNEYVQTTPPAPVGGRAEFDRYIRENIRRPDTTTSGQRVVVVLDFIVRNNGIIDSIKVVRSPGSNFSDEAIRLLKEGPAWKPATENGSPVNDNVRLRIVFK